MTSTQSTMRAWTAVGAGAPKDVLKFRHDWHMPPKTKSGEIMVRVSYVALNPGDVKMMAHKVPFKGTTIPAMDLVGEIVQIGPSITSTPASLKIGMTVAGTTSMTNVWRGIGTLAEYVVLPATMVVEKPEGLDESIAAGLLGVAGQTSYVLTDTAGLHEGDRALINGASGGVGCILTQALRGMGVSVTAVCSSKNAAMVRRLGAEEVVDYTAHSSIYDHLSSLCATKEQSFDAVFDCVGNDTLFHRSQGFLKADGKFLSIAAGPFGFLKFMNWPPALGGISQKFISVFSAPSGDSAREVVGWFNKGWIREVPIDTIFAMEDALKAFEKLATQRTVGKIMVRVREE